MPFFLIYILGGICGNLTSFAHTPETTVCGTVSYTPTWYIILDEKRPMSCFIIFTYHSDSYLDIYSFEQKAGKKSNFYMLKPHASAASHWATIVKKISVV